LGRPDGKQETFTSTNGTWVADPDITDVLTEADNAQGVATSYTVFIAALRQFETYSATGVLQTVTDASGQGITLTYSTASTPSSVAVAPGLLLTVTDPEGRQLHFTYDAFSRVNQITLPDGGTLIYTHESSYGNLLSVQYADGKTRQYVYNESSLNSGASLPSALTGRIDEASARYESTTYNGNGQAILSSLVGGANATQITYNSNGTATIQYPLGTSVIMGFATISGLTRVASMNQPCGPQCDQPWKTRTYDANGNPLSSTDFNGNTTATTYNSVNLLTQQIDAQGQPTQRTTNTTWNTTLRVPLLRTVLNASGTAVTQTGWTYNTTGQTLARCEIDPTQAASYTCAATGTVPTGVRRWTYTYCTAVDTVQCPLVGLLLSVTGPRTDLTQTTTYSYYLSSSATSCGTPGAACHQVGDLYQVTDALGHVTTLVSYDADGRITRTTDANGVNTDLTYTPRGWLATRSVGGATTSFGYTPYGAVATVTDPDGVITTYGYDAAHRLTKITDALGNYVQYTLDAAGDKTAEQVYDSTGTLHKSLSRSYNTLGQLTATVDGLSNTVFNAGYSDSYDANGNLVHSADALGFQRKLGYDALNRLASTIANYNGSDTATQNTTTGYGYDSLDRLTQVTDPSNLATTYQYNGLSDAIGQTSPDTGSTTRTVDAAGNVLTSTDAKGITAVTTYDALDRRISVSYPDTTQNLTLTYDEANSVTGCASSNPIGRLTRLVENSVTSVYCYDARGNVIQKQQITSAGTDTTAYTYTTANRLSGITYPSGSQVAYSRDGDGRIQSVSLTPVNGTASAAVSSVSYLPFGPVASYTLGNGQTVTRSYDANYRFTDVTSSAMALHFAHDAMGDITALGNASGANPATESYAYDPLYRLSNVTEAGGTVLESYTYNPTGDRLSKTASITEPGTGAYSYTSGAHQLIGVGSTVRTADANGNTTSSASGSNTLGFGYNARNRLTVVQSSGTTVGTYTYNALGQRIGKVASVPAAVTERYDYGQGSHLLGEYGTTNRDYVWLGSLLVATVDNTTVGTTTTATTNYVHVDGLGTPRAVTNSAGTVVWQSAYAGNPFGQQPPTSTTGYVLNLGFPGQYYDAESGLYYNMHRDFDSGTGRYLQSDPRGLNGGQASTYAYVNGNPLSSMDPLGLAVGDEYATINEAGVAAVTDILGASIINNQEYAGVVYQNWDGTYSYTAPNPGTENNSDTGDAPLFHKEVADYHTHSGDDEGGLAECFSDQDINSNNAKGEPGFLGTPLLAIKRYDPNPGGDPWLGTVTTLQKGISP
ncbi:MAG: DUF4329 domain-containing protein, partial [Rhodanobacter sp.]